MITTVVFIEHCPKCKQNNKLISKLIFSPHISGLKHLYGTNVPLRNISFFVFDFLLPLTINKFSK